MDLAKCGQVESLRLTSDDLRRLVLEASRCRPPQLQFLSSQMPFSHKFKSNFRESSVIFDMFEVVHQAVAYGSLLNDSEKQAGAIVETREEGYL